MGLRGKTLFWVVAALVATLDLGTKAWVFASLGVDPHEWNDRVASSPAHRREVIGDHVVLVAQMNPGMMWGMLRSYSGPLLIFRFVALGVILFLLWETNPRHKTTLITLGAILGGATGNIFDSLQYSRVRDFLHLDFGFPPFHPWPAFNVADSAICVGVIALAFTMLKRPHAQAAPAAMAPRALPEDSRAKPQGSHSK